MKSPVVTRDRYELLEHNFNELRGRLHRAEKLYDDLMAKYHELKVQGQSARVVTQGKHHAPAPEPEEVAIANAESMAIKAMAEDFRRNGLTPEKAEQEARRIATSFAASAPAPLY